MPSANPNEIHKLKSFNLCQLIIKQLVWTVTIISWGFQDFLFYLAKYFWSLLSSPNLIIQQCLALAM